MNYSTNIEELTRSVFGCLHCNGCHYGDWPNLKEICPIYSHENTFTHTAGGLMYLAKALIKGQLEYSQHLSDLVYTCTACRACDSQCMVMRAANPDMALSDIIRLMKYEMVKRDLVPERLKPSLKAVKEHGDLHAAGDAEPKIPASIRDDKSDTVLYAECYHQGGQAEVMDDAVGLLAKIGKKVAVFADGGCCGSSLFDHGFWDQLPKLVNEKADKMKAYDGKTFLYVNPHCQEFTTNRYSLIAEEFEGVKGQHISEVLAEALKDGTLKPKNGKKIKVAYHDPCMLGRGLGVTEPPREALAALDGVEVVEMDRNRQDSFCCGSKGNDGYFDGYRDATAKERIREFEDTGADIMITACHYCKTQFQRAYGDKKDKVKDLCEFVSERVE